MDIYIEHVQNFYASSSSLISLLLLLPKPLYLPYYRSRKPKKLAEPKAPPFDPHSIDKEIDQRPVAQHIDAKDAEIAPLVASTDVQRRQVLIATGVCTVLTQGS